MPDSGVDLGVDIYRLWQAGRDNLPSVAREYWKANASVAATDDGLASAFARPAEFGSGTYGPVYKLWVALRDEFQAVLGDTSKNLAEVGEALCMAASEYAKADGEAAAELDRLRRENGDFPPMHVPPPIYP